MPRQSGRRGWVLETSISVVRIRCDGKCEARAAPGCTGQYEHAHHRVLRSQGGADEPFNLIGVCHVCHDFIHANPAEALKRDLIRHGDRDVRIPYPER